MGNLQFVSLATVLGAVLLSPVASADPMKTFEGQKLFKSLCFVCHGPDGKGDGPIRKKMADIHPADLTDPRTIARSDAQLRGIIAGTDRHSPSVMPKWGPLMREADIEALVAYVRFLQRSKHRLIGDPNLGRRIYNDYCVSCHGEGGKGDGIKAGLLPRKPADHTDPKRMDRYSNEDLAEIIANGKDFMPAWEDTLSPTEIKAVTSYIRILAFQ